MDKIWPSFNKNNPNKTKKLIKKYFKTHNNLQNNIIYETLWLIKTCYIRVIIVNTKFLR